MSSNSSLSGAGTPSSGEDACMESPSRGGLNNSNGANGRKRKRETEVDLSSLPPIDTLDPDNLKVFTKEELKAYLSSRGINSRDTKPDLKRQLRLLIHSIRQTGDSTAYHLAEQNGLLEATHHRHHRRQLEQFLRTTSTTSSSPPSSSPISAPPHIAPTSITNASFGALPSVGSPTNATVNPPGSLLVASPTTILGSQGLSGAVAPAGVSTPVGIVTVMAQPQVSGSLGTTGVPTHLMSMGSPPITQQQTLFQLQTQPNTQILPFSGGLVGSNTSSSTPLMSSSSPSISPPSSPMMQQSSPPSSPPLSPKKDSVSIDRPQSEVKKARRGESPPLAVVCSECRKKKANRECEFSRCRSCCARGGKMCQVHLADLNRWSHHKKSEKPAVDKPPFNVNPQQGAANSAHSSGSSSSRNSTPSQQRKQKEIDLDQLSKCPRCSISVSSIPGSNIVLHLQQCDPEFLKEHSKTSSIDEEKPTKNGATRNGKSNNRHSDDSAEEQARNNALSRYGTNIHFIEELFSPYITIDEIVSAKGYSSSYHQAFRRELFEDKMSSQMEVLENITKAYESNYDDDLEKWQQQSELFAQRMKQLEECTTMEEVESCRREFELEHGVRFETETTPLISRVNSRAMEEEMGDMDFLSNMEMRRV